MSRVLDESGSGGELGSLVSVNGRCKAGNRILAAPHCTRETYSAKRLYSDLADHALLCPSIAEEVEFAL